MKRTVNETAANKFDEAASTLEPARRDKVWEGGASFTKKRPPRFESRAALPGRSRVCRATEIGPHAADVTHTRFAIVAGSVLATIARPC